jgi:hypothetical protein
MMTDNILDLSPKLTILPILYGSADFALEVRYRLQRMNFDCLAVALPPSFEAPVERGIAALPRITVAVQGELSPEGDPSYNYVPVDPCQGLIAAIREAIHQQVDRAYVDLEVATYESHHVALPDPYALKEVRLERFLAAVIPALPAPHDHSQRASRIARMAYELHCLELEYEHVVFVCAIADWPWIRKAYRQRATYEAHARADLPHCSQVDEESLFFILGELPYITFLYEHRRAELLTDRTLSLDGVKSLLLEAREQWAKEQDLGEQHWLTSSRLSVLLKYVRNLTLSDRRLTPDLYNLALASKQVVGDDFALAVIEKSRKYAPQRIGYAGPLEAEVIHFGPDKLLDGDGRAVSCKNRLQGIPKIWRNLAFKPTPPEPESQPWQLDWDPAGHCSYPPEDQRIESFQRQVRESALQFTGEEQPKVERFSASLKDGLDLRETLRNWHTGEIFVQELPRSRGAVEIVVFLFEQPVVPNRYPWCSTWYAEHEEESTLCFFATDFNKRMVGPGVGQALYGGCFFLFPPRPIPDIWRDPRLRHARSREERMLLGALLHSREKRVVLVAPQAPSQRWRRLARQYKKQIAYIPLKRFSPAAVDRLRRFHVLNGRYVRSYAAKFIRDFR